MEDLIRENKELTVEDNLRRIVRDLKDRKRNALKVGAWVFNSEYGTHVYGSNMHVPQPNDFNEQQISEYHAEQLCISSLPREFKLKGTNTLFVTLIPCKYCVEFLKKQIKENHLKLQVIYFVDYANKAKGKVYKDLAKGLPMTKYINKGKEPKDEAIRKLIKKISWFVNGNH